MTHCDQMGHIFAFHHKLLALNRNLFWMFVCVFKLFINSKSTNSRRWSATLHAAAMHLDQNWQPVVWRDKAGCSGSRRTFISLKWIKKENLQSHKWPPPGMPHPVFDLYLFASSLLFLLTDDGVVIRDSCRQSHGAVSASSLRPRLLRRNVWALFVKPRCMH